MLEYRSVADLNKAIINNITNLPCDLDLIVGVPRSGLWAANLLALYLNLPLADVDGFAEGRVLGGGNRAAEMIASLRNSKKKLRVLVLDDSCLTGDAISNVKEKLRSVSNVHTVFYCAVYAQKRAVSHLDFHFETVYSSRVFEWNILHNSRLSNACLDIDGVLCRDPSEIENDDDENYLKFIKSATPLVIPTVHVGQLVTSRLEKYRRETEQWLAKHNVNYGELVMLDLPSKEERIRLNAHARFKSSVYAKSSAVLFVESSVRQAKEIAMSTKKPVFCTEDHAMYYGYDYERVRKINNRRETIGRCVRWIPAPVRRPFKKILQHLGFVG